MPAQMACSADTDEVAPGWVSDLEEQLLGSLKSELMCQGSFTGGSAMQGHTVASTQRNSSSGSGLTSMQHLQQQQVQQQALRSSHRHYHAPDPRQTSQQQQQQQAYGLQYQQQQQQQTWGSVPRTCSMLAASGAPALNPWYPLPTEGPSNPANNDCSPDPVSSSNSSAFGLGPAAPGSSHNLTHFTQGAAGISNSQAMPRSSTGLKRANSIDQDALLFNLLQEMAPAGKRC